MQMIGTSESTGKVMKGKAPIKRSRTSAAAKKTLHLKEKSADNLSDDLVGMIATAAYFCAEKRRFEPGHELEDWLVAEREVKAALRA